MRMDKARKLPEPASFMAELPSASADDDLEAGLEVEEGDSSVLLVSF